VELTATSQPGSVNVVIVRFWDMSALTGINSMASLLSVRSAAHSLLAISIIRSEESRQSM
jgi:hypothetical protein